MKFGFIFPGQGSQSIGMMSGYAELACVRSTFDQASAILEQDLWVLAAQGPAPELDSTINTQPLMLTAGVAVYRAWCELGGTRPDWLAGHSLGEYTALVVAGSLDFSAALHLTRERARAMQDAVPQGTGAMAAILGLDDDQVRAACTTAQQDQIVEPANFNTPGQVVIAGHRPAVERAMYQAKTLGAKRALLLPMSVPSHCQLMHSAAQRLQQYLEQVEIRPPAIPVLHNASVAPAATSAEIRMALVQQLYRPVRWVETIRKLGELGLTTLYECGPGKVLGPMVKRIDPRLQGMPLQSQESILNAVDPETIPAQH